MRKLRWLPFAALVLMAVEYLVLTGVASLIGVPWAVFGALMLSLFGAYLLRREGLRAWRRLRTAQRSGGPAGDEVLYDVVGLFAALLLLIPGYFTGALGLILLVPPVRRLVRDRMRRATESRVSSQTAGDLFGPRHVRVQPTRKPPPGSEAAGGDVVEGEIVE